MVLEQTFLYRLRKFNTTVRLWYTKHHFPQFMPPCGLYLSEMISNVFSKTGRAEGLIKLIKESYYHLKSSIQLNFYRVLEATCSV